MSLELFLYLVSVLGNISILCQGISLVIFGALIIYGCFYIVNVDGYYGEDEKTFKKNTLKVIKRLLVSMAIITPFMIIIPSEKIMYAIGFSHYAKQTQIPQKLIDLLNQKLDDALGGEKT